MRARHAALVSATAALAALTGCGIRPTEGPVGAGEPATRPTQTASSAVPGTEQHVIYLVRDNRLRPLPRPGRVQLPPADGQGDAARRKVLDQLLEELHAGPGEAESLDGYTSALPAGGLRAAVPRPGDPAVLVRLDAPLGALATVALGQVVCTLQSALGGDAVQLAGSRGEPETHRCDTYQDMSRKTPSPTSPRAPRSVVGGG